MAADVKPVRVVDRWEYPNGVYRTTGVCRLAVFRDATRFLCVVSELDDNPGMSVTNAAEAINDKLRREYGDDVVQIEHYPRGIRPHSFDLVTVTGGTAGWRHLPSSAVGMLIGDANVAELIEATS